MKILDIPQAGKRGVTVSQGGRFGQISRILAIPANPQTEDQLLIRNYLDLSATHWRVLTEEQRLAWIAKAATMQSQPVLGQSGPLTGLMLYTKLNCTLQLLGEATIDDVPADPEFVANTVTGLTITNTAGVIAIKLAADTALMDLSMVRGSPPQSAGIYKCSNFRYLGIPGAPSAGFIVITTMYTQQFGVPPVGSRVFVQVNQTHHGYQDIPHKFNALVPAAA